MDEATSILKITVIVSLLVALAIHFYLNADKSVLEVSSDGPIVVWNFDNLCYLAGVLLIVQGFETSRYLGSAFSVETRIRSMRLAQVLSTVYLSIGHQHSSSILTVRRAKLRLLVS